MRIWLAIWDGSAHLSRSIGAWIAGGVAPRLLAAALALGFIKGLTATTHILYATAAAWTASAIALGYRHPSPATLKLYPQLSNPDEQPADSRTAPTLDRDALVRALHEIGTPHAHVAALADHLGITADATRAALAEAGIPTEACRMKGRGSSTGVKAEHFPPLPSPASETPESVVDAGQGDNNNPRKVLRWPWGHTVSDPAEHIHHAVTKTPRSA